MAIEDADVRRFVTWKIFPFALVVGTIWYYRQKGVTFKSLKRKLAAIVIANLMARFNKKKDIVATKKRLFSNLEEQKTNRSQKLQILEIGVGGGANFTFYPPGSQVVCLDPNPNFRSYIQQSIEESNVEMKRFIQGFAEKLETVEDDSVDSVVCSMVLCSVRDLDKTMSEVRRVLKPNGTFYFIEHVAAKRGTCLNRVQGWLNPIWYCFSGDCQVNKETGKAVDRAGFSQTSINYLNLNTYVFLIRPILWGTATK